MRGKFTISGDPAELLSRIHVNLAESSILKQLNETYFYHFVSFGLCFVHQQKRLTTATEYRKIEQMKEISSSTVDGLYLNSTPDSTRKSDLFASLSFYNTPRRKQRHLQFISDSSMIVRLSYDDRKSLSVELLDDNMVKEKRTYKVKKKNDYLYFRPRLFLVPILPLLYFYSSKRAALGISQNNELIIHSTFDEGAMVIIMGSGHSFDFTSNYKKVSSAK